MTFTEKFGACLCCYNCSAHFRFAAVHHLGSFCSYSGIHEGKDISDRPVPQQPKLKMDFAPMVEGRAMLLLQLHGTCLATTLQLSVSDIAFGPAILGSLVLTWLLMLACVTALLLLVPHRW